MGGEVLPTDVSELIERGVLAINDGYRAKNSELGKNRLPFARGGNINGGFHFEGADCFPRENLDRVGEKTSQPGDAVFTSKGSVGRFAFVTADVPTFVYSPQLCFWRSLDHDVISPRWLYYWMYRAESYQQYNGVKGQTDMADIVSLRDQRGMHITLPPVKEQTAVAEILGTLDDKIELNRQMNRTLEAMARAIFKAWFVDFEPVKAKAAGATSFRGMPQPVFDHSPTASLNRTGAGAGGVGGCPLSDLVELIGGGTPKRKMAEYWDGDMPWFSVRDAPNDGDVWVIDTEEKITKAGVANSSAKIMKAGTSIISARGTVGRLALTAIPMAMNQSCYGVTGKNGVGDFCVYLCSITQ